MMEVWNILFSVLFILWLFATTVLLWLIWRLGINRMNRLEDELTKALDKTLEVNQRLSKLLEDKQ